MDGNNASNELEDSFDKDEIEQLHKAVLGISGQCFEIKKLCVTIELSVCTLVTTIFREIHASKELLFVIKIIIFSVPMFFYFVDICTYYYQDKLRKTMFDIENKIRCRHNVQLKNDKRFNIKNYIFVRRLFKSIVNGTNIIYWGLIGFAIIFYKFV
jgi:hypothetical protein